MKYFSEPLWEFITGLWHGDSSEEVDFQEGEGEALMKDQFLIRQAMRREEEHAYDVDKAWRRVVRASQRRRGLLRGAVKYAAVLALLLAGAYGVFQLSMPQEPVSYANVLIVPGTAKAEFVLSTGEKIPLSAHGAHPELQQHGILLVNDTASGRLRYQTVDAQPLTPDRHNILNVPKGGEYQLALPDGTDIWVNSESSVRFPEKFAADCREVWLEGEAYFKVAKNDRSPFRVHIGERVITVVGTSFNVSAYHDDEVWRTTLVEGCIRMSGEGKEVEIKPSEQYVLDRRTGEYRVDTVNSRLYTSWVDGRFYFRGFTFDEIVKKLERWYDFQMIYGDEAIKSRKFTGFVDKHEPIEDMLTLLEMTTNIHFQIKEKEIRVMERK